MKKVKSNKLGLNKQVVANLVELKAGKVAASYWCSGYVSCRGTCDITCANTCAYTCDGCVATAMNSVCFCG